MQSHRKYFLLLLLPLLFLISGLLLKGAQGPYFLNFYDPSYVYLISSLNILQFDPVGHFDHPGTTVQVLLSGIVKITHLISGQDKDLIADVIENPESYLFIAEIVLLILGSAALYFAGYITMRCSKSIAAAMFIQFTPFISTEVFYGMIIVTPDNLLIAIMLFFMSIVICGFYKSEDGKDTSDKLVYFYAIACGLGLATKLNFIPVLIIPLMLIQGRIQKIKFISAVVLIFIILTVPVWSNYGKFFMWVKKLTFNSGRFGQSEQFINTESIPDNIARIFNNVVIFSFSYVISIAALIIAYMKKDSLSEHARKSRKYILALFISTTLGLFMVMRNFEEYYLIPYIMLSILSLYFCFMIVAELFRLKTSSLVLPAFAVIAIFSAFQFASHYNTSMNQRKQAEDALNFINTNYSNSVLIPAYQSAGKDCGLRFAVEYAGINKSMYSALINKKARSTIFYNPWSKSISSGLNSDEVKSAICGSKKIVLQLGIFGSPEDFISAVNQVCGVKDFAFNRVYSNAYNERVYEIVHK